MQGPAHRLSLRVVEGAYSFCRLDSAAPLPPWAQDTTLSIVLRSKKELSIVCPSRNVPPAVRAVGPWKALVVDGVLDFDQVGIIASLAGPLAAAGISIAPVASFDTDYVFVREDDLERAIGVLREAGHTVVV
ncbi:MAG TPA: ACT domain-containing protein [Phycisphaerales bacterium]